MALGVINTLAEHSNMARSSSGRTMGLSTAAVSSDNAKENIVAKPKRTEI
ncbi:hypothetical protein PVAG01_01379 [Phlyctema vagabunda]|uniref:Uncharacterized protein n=1 Tax=Phlyctema vagabunda TaxID=108571 RepID=A0ABR4PWZ4_9HELO